MNCESLQRRLLALERPDRPPGEVRRHLDACASCRGWHEQLLSLENDVLALPVPPPTRKQSFLRRLRTGADLPQAMSLPIDRAVGFNKREQARRKIAIAVALAASLLIVTLAALFWKSSTPGDPTPVNGNSHVSQTTNRESNKDKTILDKRMSSEAAWRQARTPRERIHALDAVAREVESGALAIGRNGLAVEELNAQIDVYRELIRELADRQAPLMDEKERRELIDPIARRLAEVDSTARRLAVRVPDAARSLRELAEIAAEGDRRLRALL